MESKSILIIVFVSVICVVLAVVVLKFIGYNNSTVIGGGVGGGVAGAISSALLEKKECQ